MSDTDIYRIAFASIRGMHAGLASQLLEVVGSERAFFEMSESELRQATGGGRSKVYTSFYRSQQLERARHEAEFVESKGIHLLFHTDPSYPRRLLQADDAPCLLYAFGQCDLESAHVVSVVGTRHATAYGKSWTDTFVGDLVARLPDVVIVSGLAYGIDIAAHRACLRHGATTVAVMARGLDKIYPATHRKDAADIIRHGGMALTEYQTTDQIHRSNFLARNRIIAGLSDCTVVVESATTGGALVTASLAQSYNRDVMAVPGRVGDEFSKGCNMLIRTNRAMALTCADELIEAMRWDADAKPAGRQLELFPELTADQQKVTDLLRGRGDMHINDIAEATGVPIYRIMSTLVELDCKGIVLTMPGCRYSLK